MQKYELSCQTHKMTIVLRLKLYKILLYTARIGYENIYDMCEIHYCCRESNTYKLLTPISKPRHVDFSYLIMQKYELSPQTHKITIVSRLKLYKILLYTARIAYENTYDMRGILYSQI